MQFSSVLLHYCAALLSTCLFQWEINYELQTLRVHISARNRWSDSPEEPERVIECVWSSRQNICPRSPVCISTDRLFVHLEPSDPTEYKDQKTLWGCFSSLKSFFFLLIQSGLKCTVQTTEWERRSARSCSTWSILVTGAGRRQHGYWEPATRGWTRFCSIMCVCVSDKNSSYVKAHGCILCGTKERLYVCAPDRKREDITLREYSLLPSTLHWSPLPNTSKYSSWTEAGLSLPRAHLLWFIASALQ